MRFILLPAALLVLLEACGYLDAPGTPVVEAHRGGAAYFPQDSASAVHNAVTKGYPGIEFDLTLTADGVPVLSHDPWLHQTHCTRSDGTPLPQAKADRIYIRDVTAADLRAGYVCGGVADETQPDAQVIAEPLMTFDELLVELAQAPAMLVHIDVKYEPGMTDTPERFAAEILSRWRGAQLPNPWYASANLPEQIAALEGHSAEGPIETSLAWPRFPPDSEDQQTAIALRAEGMALTGLETLAGIARDAGADGIAVAYQVADRHQIEVARDAGLKVQIWTPNSKTLLATYCEWPLDTVITDMPEAAPCF